MWQEQPGYAIPKGLYDWEYKIEIKTDILSGNYITKGTYVSYQLTSSPQQLSRKEVVSYFSRRNYKLKLSSELSSPSPLEMGEQGYLASKGYLITEC